MSDKLKMTGAKITISGTVQGVGFRYYIALAAEQLGLKGYAKNLFNGNVEIYAEGRKEFVEELAKKAKIGPSNAHVLSAKVEWLDFKNKYDNFDIK